MRRRLCGDPVRTALRAIGRERMALERLCPDDFTEGERYRMLKAVLHNHAFPGGPEGDVPEWRIERRLYSLTEWQTDGRRRFVKEVVAAALGELDDVDYTEYDLSPLRQLIGNHGPNLCARLAVADQAAYRLRLEAMKADLALFSRRAQELAGMSASAEITYRVSFYEHAFEARIRTGGCLASLFMKGK